MNTNKRKILKKKNKKQKKKKEKLKKKEREKKQIFFREDMRKMLKEIKKSANVMWRG